jgi:hypothetical protein
MFLTQLLNQIISSTVSSQNTYSTPRKLNVPYTANLCDQIYNNFIQLII